MKNKLFLTLASLVMMVSVVSAGTFSLVRYQPTPPSSLKKEF